MPPRRSLLGAWLAGTLVALAAAASEPVGWTATPLPPASAPWPAALRRVATAPGVEVRRDGAPLLRLWPVPGVAGPAAAAERVAHPDLVEGALVALLELDRPWTDFRGQSIAAGRFLLRYARQPPLPDHEGTAPWRDFLLLGPVATDDRPDRLSLALLLAGGRRASGTSHPAVLALLPPPEPAPASNPEIGVLRRGPAGEPVLVVTALGRRRGLVLAGLPAAP